jgi:selenocysteine lyase/cysteine desulfurase
MAASLDLEKVRSHFPALKSGFVFGDNAGGSQTVQDAIDRTVDYLVNTNIQMGSDYGITSTHRCTTESQEAAAEMFNAASPDEIVFGGSSTQNLENLARGLEEDVQSGDEIIVTQEHEANGGPWKSMARRRGAVIKTWLPRKLSDAEDNDFAIGLDVEDLLPLITAKTRLLAFTACSNILGSILPVKDIVTAARKKYSDVGGKKLEICLDCVAYAPHARIDVQDWDVDFCVFSYYKVYGPHMSAMYVRKSVLETSVRSVVHHFLSPYTDSIGYKLQPAGPGYETVWGTTAVAPYVKSLTASGTLEAGFEAMRAHDSETADQILKYLTQPKLRKRGVRVIGSEQSGPNRMPTISILVREGAAGEPAMKSKDLIAAVDKFGTVSYFQQ